MVKALRIHPIEKRMKVRGLRISIETLKGHVRSGVDSNGKKWSITMPASYGYICRTIGVGEDSKDRIDCFVGPNRASNRVFIVNINDPSTGIFDEQKIFLFFNDPIAVRKTFRRAYNNDHKFFGSMEELTFKEFKDRALATRHFPNVIRGKVNHAVYNLSGEKRWRDSTDNRSVEPFDPHASVRASSMAPDTQPVDAQLRMRTR
jgi:hypothetical protein